METAVKSYRRLPGRGASLTHYYSLYEGPEGLLQVASTGWSERYKRFYYEDITAFVVRRTNTGTVFNLILAALALPCVVLALLDVARPVMLILGAAILIPLVYSLLAGPTCVCHVYTTVQVERVPSLRRLRAARRFLDRIRPPIEQAQRTPPPVPAAAASANPGGSGPDSAPAS